MKKSLLIGLTAVALGSMTACSNILEEEGTISAKTGTLTIALEADGSLDVATKAEETSAIIMTDEMAKDLNVKVIHSNGTEKEVTSDPTKVDDKLTYTINNLPTGTYSVTADYNKMKGVLDFGTPIFSGSTTNVNVTKDTEVDASFEITLFDLLI